MPTCLFTLVAGLFLLVGWGYPADGLDLSAHRIERVRNESVTEYHGFHYEEWRNFLVFSNSIIRIPLARSGTTRVGSDHLEPEGFDPGTLKLRWLKEGELLSISWTTFSRGSGHYTYDGHVLLRVHDEGVDELFRDYFNSIARGGWESANYSRLAIGYDAPAGTITLARRNTGIQGGYGSPPAQNLAPFANTFTNDQGELCYLSQITTVKKWHCRLAGSTLEFIRGTTAVDLGEEVRPILDIAKGFDVERSDLESLNPLLQRAGTASGMVMLRNDLQPYAASSYDGLHGNQQ